MKVVEYNREHLKTLVKELILEIENDKFYRKNANPVCPDCKSLDIKLRKVEVVPDYWTG